MSQAAKIGPLRRRSLEGHVADVILALNQKKQAPWGNEPKVGHVENSDRLKNDKVFWVPCYALNQNQKGNMVGHSCGFPFVLEGKFCTGPTLAKHLLLIWRSADLALPRPPSNRSQPCCSQCLRHRMCTKLKGTAIFCSFKATTQS